MLNLPREIHLVGIGKRGGQGQTIRIFFLTGNVNDLYQMRVDSVVLDSNLPVTVPTQSESAMIVLARMLGGAARPCTFSAAASRPDAAERAAFCRE